MYSGNKMGFSEKLSEFYTNLEDKYFNVLDALEDRGLPVYKYSDFFEDKGIPSFIVTITIFIAILLLLSLLFGPNVVATGEIVVNIKDVATGQGLQNVKLSIQRETGSYIYEDLTIGDGTTINVPPLQIGTRLRLIATKDGYQPLTEEIILGSQKAQKSLLLERSLTSIEGKLRLVDEQTKTRITDARVSARYSNQEYTFNLDANGNFINTSIPEGVNVSLRVSADGYLPIEETQVFFSGTIRDISLRPDTSAFSGKSMVLVSVSDPQGNSIEQAKVTIYDKESGTILLEDFSLEGIVSGPIQSGIPLRITVSKEGYINYDSEKEGESKTLRRPEERIDVTLRQGGEKLNVSVVNQLGLGLSGATVQIFNKNNLRLREGTTTATGVEFTGLDPESEIIITASRSGYLPKQTKVFTGQVENVPIILTEADSINSTRIDIFTIDEFGNPIPNAKLDIFVIEDGNDLPYGISGAETNIGGFKDIVVEKQKAYRILAESKIMQGGTTVEIGDEVFDSKVYINMRKKPNVVDITLRDIFGNLAIGRARVSGLDGQILFDGEIENGKIFFNAENRKIVDLEVDKLDGNIFKTQVNVSSDTSLEVIVYERGSKELAPEIEFVGIETEDGRTVKGITPGAFYLIKFKVSFPIASQESGVHIRTGLNSNTFATEDNVALFSIETMDGQSFYSYSYNQDPSLGDEVIDRSNQGFVGEANKWGETIIKNPTGTYIVKAKIRASEFTSGKIPIHYRAWSKIDSEYYRTPFDEELGFNARSDEVDGLYAKTETLELTLYESLPDCSDDLCATINFVDENENFYDTLGFEALTNEVYALEIEFTSIKGDFLQVSLETDNNLVFLGTQTGSFGFTDRSTQERHTETSTTVNITPNGKQKVRFYFRADTPGAKIINLFALGDDEIVRQLSFNAVVEKDIIVELSESNVLLGRNFTVRVLDNDLSGIPNALVKIINKEGSVVKSISGNNTDGRGLNGNYRVENNLETGLYIVEVSVPRHKTKQEPLLISTTRILDITEETNVRMLSNERQKIITKEIRNNSAFTINDISYEVSESENFRVTGIVPPTISESSNQSFQLTVEFIGDGEYADEVLDFTIRGMIEGRFLASASGKINVSYNEKLDSSCLVITPSSLTMNIVGRAGASDSDIIEVTNNCEEAVFLSSRTREITRKSFVLVRADDISLQPGQTKNVSISADNLVERQFARNETFNYEIVWDANYITKRMNVSVNIINPKLSLSYPGQITMFLAQDAPQRPAIAANPIFVTNISQFPIDGIRFSIDKDYGSNLTLSVEPNVAVDLGKGQSISPARMLFAQSSSNFSEPIHAKILIEGQLGNLNNRSGMRDNYNYDDFLTGRANISNYSPSNTGYSSGQEVLGVINVEIHFSGLDCLKGYIAGENIFNLSALGAQRSSQIGLINTCAEPVRIINAEAAYREIVIGVPNVIVSPGENVHLPMSVFSLNPNLRLRNHPVTIVGITEMSQTPIRSTPINIDIYSGIEFSDEFSKATSGIQVNVCEQEQKETISIPISANRTNCSEGYCDALQASEYLARKLDNALKRATSTAYSSQRDIESLACGAQRFCTFGQLGIEQEQIELYLKNDIVSVGALREEFSKITSGTSTGFRGQPGEYLIQRESIGDNIIQFIAATGFGRQIFIDQELEGCGYYSLTINGAFPTTPTGVEFESPVIVIRVNQKVNTRECNTSIENLINFTPVNTGYTIGSDRGTWATTVTAENNVRNIGEEIAKKMFGENRFGAGNGNTISIEEGNVAGGLAQICVRGTQKKNIVVTVNPSANLGEQRQSAFEQQIVKMVTESLVGNFGENCLVQDANNYSCVKLTDTGGTSGLEIELAQRTLVFSPNNETTNCVEATVKSIVPEGIYFEAIPGEKFNGIRKLTVESIDNSEVYYSKEFIGGGRAITEIDREIVLEMNETLREARYEKRVNICAVPGTFETGSHSEGAYFSANQSEFTIRAINKSAGQAQGAQSEKITVSTGTLHPDDWLEIFFKQRDMIEKRGVDNPYYFTAMWEGEPSIINLREYEDSRRNLGLGGDYRVIRSSDNTLENREIISDVRRDARRAAMNSYFSWCAPTALACNAAYGGVVNGFVGGAIDCIVPAMTMMKGEMIEAYDIVERFFDSGIVRAIADLPIIGVPFRNTPAELSPQDFSPTMVGSQMALGGALGGAERILAASMGNIGKFNYTGTSGVLAREISSSVGDDAARLIGQLGIANPQGLSTDFSTTYQNALRDNLETGLREKLRNTGIRGHVSGDLIRSRRLSPTDAQEVVKAAIEKTNESVDLGRFLNDRQLLPDNLTPELRHTLPNATINSTPNQVDAVIRQKLDALKEMADRTAVDGSRGRIANPDRFIINNADIQARNVASDIIDELAVGRSIPEGDLIRMKQELASGISTGTRNLDDVASTMSNNFRKMQAKTANRQLFTFSSSEIDNIANQIKATGSTPNPRHIKSRINPVAGRFLFSLGAGIACGAISNAVGLHYYNQTFNEVEKEERAQASGGLEGTLIKGEMVKVILSRETDGPIMAEYYNVTGNPELEREMREKLSTNEDGEIMGTFLYWTDRLSQEPPQERPLTQMLMRTNLNELREQLYEVNMKREDVIKIIDELKRSSNQQLIHIYTSGNTQTNNRRLVYEGFPIPEPWVGSLAIMMDNYSFVDKENEIKGRETKLRDKVMELAEKVHSTGDEIAITQQIAQEIFSDREKADKFFKLNVAWRTYMVYDPANYE